MAATRPLRTAIGVARLTPAEKRKLDKLCRDNDVSLSQALRMGALLYLHDLNEMNKRRLHTH